MLDLNVVLIKGANKMPIDLHDIHFSDGEITLRELGYKNDYKDILIIIKNCTISYLNPYKL